MSQISKDFGKNKEKHSTKNSQYTQKYGWDFTNTILNYKARYRRLFVNN